MNSLYRFALFAPATALLFFRPAMADTPQGWSGKGEAGMALASTNADTSSTTLNAKFDLAKELDKWKHEFGASIVYASSKNTTDGKQTTSDRWEAHQQSDYKFTPSFFVFEALKHENDYVGSFVYQNTFTLGLGYQIFDSEVTKLTFQGGAGYREFKTRSIDEFGVTVEGEKESSAVVTLLADYKQALTANTSLFEKLAAEFAKQDTKAQNDLGIQVKMSDRLALALAYQVIYHSRPAEGFEHYDRLTTANLVYNIK